VVEKHDLQVSEAGNGPPDNQHKGRGVTTLQHFSGSLEWGSDSRLRLVTLVRLRWIAVLGQLATVLFVAFYLQFPVALGVCLALIALSAWFNVFLVVRFPARHRLSIGHATLMLTYDIMQLAALLYATGGIENPFTMLIVAPVTVSAGSLPPKNTGLLAALTVLAIVLLATTHMPLPWYPGLRLDLPMLYQVGYLAAVAASMLFIAMFAWRLSKESRQMSAALAATDLVLAREQKLHALDGLAAAAAHELGTPLSTIVLVAKELERESHPMSPMREDLALLRSQAMRCREILTKLTRSPSAQDPLHAHVSMRELLDESVAPYRAHQTTIQITAKARPDASPDGMAEPIGERRPGVIYGIGNLIENAIDFALDTVQVSASWNDKSVQIEIVDDGPGFPADVLETLGEPYVTTRSAGGRMGDGESKGMGLGFFIAKTLLERSGASVTLANQELPLRGAIVQVNWPRSAFEAGDEGRNFLPGHKGRA
jgi:two-component system, sensor histidine kinase RegB